MIAKIAVSAANYAIDKPYSYRIPEDMTLLPGQRVQLPFGRGNTRCEGVVLAVETGEEAQLKAVERCLDEEPILTATQLRLAAFLRERYFCTFYDAIRAMLPAGLWFQSRDSYALTEDRSWQEKTLRKEGAMEILQLLQDLGGETDEKGLGTLNLEETVLSDAIGYLVRKKWLTAKTDFHQRTHDKTEQCGGEGALLLYRRIHRYGEPAGKTGLPDSDRAARAALSGNQGCKAGRSAGAECGSAGLF